MKKSESRIVKLLKDKLFLLFLGFICIFMAVILKFYQLQIIDYDLYANNLRASVERTIEVPATRGLIYDRYGRPLAINVPTKVLKVDQQVNLRVGQLNAILLDVANVLESNGDSYIDNIPITEDSPFEYTTTENGVNRFMYNIPYNSSEHRQELLTYSAEELVEYLKSDRVYNIAATEDYLGRELTDEEVRKIIALRTEIHPYTYSKYKQVTIATGISEETVAYIEENHSNFPGILVEVEAIRQYPEGEILGNVLGYTRLITDSQYEEMQYDGYDKDDIVGHEGVEKSMESELRGVKGLEYVEVDTLGRRVHTIEREDAIQGNDVFLTIDLDLQRAAYESIETRLNEALIDRLTGSGNAKKLTNAREILISMVESSQLDVNNMKNAPEGSKRKEVYDELDAEYNMLDETIREQMSLRDLLLEWMNEENSRLTDKEIILMLHEEGSLDLPEATVESIKQNPNGSAEGILIEQLESGKLKPNQHAVDPFSATAVVVDVNNGDVLAMVGYPSYDANLMTTDFNSYYPTLSDSRSMLWNRATMTVKAPGSTFKMLTGIAGLEEGVITTDTRIVDTGVYTKVGSPYPVCWIHTNTGRGHGSLDLEGALEVSCNYFFYEVAYRLGDGSGYNYQNIDTMTEYAKMFGLQDPTGIEIAEANPNTSTPENLVRERVNSLLGNIRLMSTERKEERVDDVVSRLERGIFPYASSSATDLNGRVEYATQYELMRNIEPVLQNAFSDSLENIVHMAYDSVQGQLQITQAEIVEDIVLNTMNDNSNRPLKSKTYDQMVKHFYYMVDPAIDRAVYRVMDTISVDEILDAYEHAYSTIYSRELAKGEDEELIQELRRRIDTMEDSKDMYVDMVADKVKQSIVAKMVDQLMENIYMEWNNGITIRTAIGQGYNAFSPIQMARYIAALANGETVYDLKLINGIYESKGDQTYIEQPDKIYGELDLKPSTIEATHNGMLRVAQGSSGTSRLYFRNYEIDVAAKTGTAQEGAHEHSWFVGFAPFDDPQVAIVTSVYNSDGLGAYGQLIARDVLNAYFRLDQEEDKVTLDNVFIE